MTILFIIFLFLSRWCHRVENIIRGCDGGERGFNQGNDATKNEWGCISCIRYDEQVKQRLKEIPKRLRSTTKTVRRLLSLVWGMDKRVFILAIFTATLPAVIPFANAYIYKLVIDAVIAGIESGNVNMEHLMVLLGSRIATYFIQDAVYSTQSFIEQMIWTRFPMLIQKKLYDRIASLDMAQLEDPALHDKLEQAKESVHRPQNVISDMMFACQSLVQFALGLVAIVYLNWLLIPFILIVTIPEFFYRLYEAQAGWTIWSWQSPLKRRWSYLSWLLQNIPSIKELRIFGLAPVFTRDSLDLQERFYRENLALSKRSYLFRLVFSALSTALFIGVEVYVILLAVARTVTVGDISFYTQIVSNFQNGIGGLLRNISSLFEDTLYVQSLFEILDTEPIMRHAEQPRDFSSPMPPTIVFDNVSFRYPSGEKDILTDISFEIRPGEKVALVGENGAGKSTIIKLLARFYDPTGGQILINGHDLREYDVANWHQHIGILFQDFNHYEDTVKQNIYYGNVRREFSMEEIERAARDGGAVSVVEGFEQKYEQMLGKSFEKGIELSAGQWQKVALARAYFRNAPVLVLDEPTASIDAKSEYEIFQRVEQLTKDKTVVLISHRFSTVRQANRILMLHEGKLLEQGTHDELLKAKGLYTELFSLQAKEYL